MRYELYLTGTDGKPVTIADYSQQYATEAEGIAVAGVLEALGLIGHWFVWDALEERCVAMKGVQHEEGKEATGKAERKTVCDLQQG